MVVEVLHANNITDRVVTAFYDKKGLTEIAGGLIHVRAPLSSTKVNRVSLDPEQSYKLTYASPVQKI